MSSLKQSVFWLAFYIGVVFILAQFDYVDSPIIDFAKYFYFMVMVAVPATIFFPFTSKMTVLVPAIVWGSIYVVMLQVLDRTVSAPNSTFPIILLEFILVEIGVWLAFQLANGISHAESVMDAMALSVFPNRTQTIQEASQQIKTEITRSRRYHRPLSLLVMQTDPSDHVAVEQMITKIQHELSNRFSFARIGQVIDEYVRQTDMVILSRSNHFAILCPETDYQNSQILAQRICDAIKSKTGVPVEWSAAAFPEDALNFDDLMDAANSRLALRSKVNEEKQNTPETQEKA
ncbi:MAG: GGDEF domain-containing protein [Anaerolineales bacterium]